MNKLIVRTKMFKIDALKYRNENEKEHINKCSVQTNEISNILTFTPDIVFANSKQNQNWK